MSRLDINKFFNNFKQPTFFASGSYNVNASQQNSSQQTTTTSSQLLNTTQITTQTTNSATNLQLNNLQNIDRAIYAKEVLNLPKNMNEFVYMVQNKMTISQFNSQFSKQILSQQNILSQMQAQVLAQLKGLDFANVDFAKLQLTTQQLQATLKNLDLTNASINLNLVSQILQTNGKEAITKLIMSMMEASKAGITDLSQMKEMAKFVNSAISIASENNNQKSLKLLMLLYLPWLPLEEGVDFEIEIEKQQKENDEEDTILIVTITTRNFGVVKVIIMLETSNSVSVSIDCDESFPQKELTSRIESEQKFYSMTSNTTYTVKNSTKNSQNTQSVNINTSQATDINPYLLLMAHAIIKQVIDIDNIKAL